MTPNAHCSPKPLILYPYLHRNSQCCSCHTVIPGDICFNCGRLSTLLVTPRPPRKSLQSAIKVLPDPVTPPNSPTMTPNAHCSPKSLTLYPYLHRNSQCCSCHTVIPGDICFNCGRLSTLLVTPRAPRNSLQSPIPVQPKPVIPRNSPILKTKAFDAQHSLVDETLLAAEKEKQVRMCPISRAFDTQLTEIDDLLDARKKLANLCTVAASDGPSATSGKGSSTSCRRPLTPLPSGDNHKSSTAHSAKISSSSKSSRALQPNHIAAEDGRPHRENVLRWMADVSPAAPSSAPSNCPPRHNHKSSTVPSAKNSSSSKSSKTLQPDPFAAEEGFSEDGRPYRETVSRWMEDVSPSATSSARLSGRGVECRLSIGGKVCEWVIFL